MEKSITETYRKCIRKNIQTRISLTHAWSADFYWKIIVFFPQAMLGGFSFRAGEHTTSAVRKIAGPNQNDYNFGKNVIGNVPEKRARKTCPLDYID